MRIQENLILFLKSDKKCTNETLIVINPPLFFATWWFFPRFGNFIRNLFSLPVIAILFTSFHWPNHSLSVTYTVCKDLIDIKFRLLLSHLSLIILYFSPSLLGGCNLINLLSFLSLLCSPRADVQFAKKQKFQASLFALERQGLQWNPETETL